MKVAARVRGQAGTSEVEFTDFPYLACTCGRLVRWAFDPSGDFSTQLFYNEDGVATAKRRRSALRADGAAVTS